LAGSHDSPSPAYHLPRAPALRCLASLGSLDFVFQVRKENIWSLTKRITINWRRSCLSGCKFDDLSYICPHPAMEASCTHAEMSEESLFGPSTSVNTFYI
jgi:hypothetical protein